MDNTASNATADSERLSDPKQPQNLIPDYSADEIEHLGVLQKMLENARNLRDTNHDEYDGMTFVEQWQAEEKSANTFIAPKINAEDTNFQSGIILDNIIQIMSQLINYDLGPQIHAYDDNQLEISSLGQAMEIIDDKLANLEGDQEKKVMRAWELFKHGYVFVEELWEERWHWSKPWVKKFEGKIKDAKWKKKLKLLYARPVRNVLSGLNVYLGDITQYDMKYQPFIFTVKYRHYDDAKSEYGITDENGKDVWDRWRYVTKARQTAANNLGPNVVYNTWRLTEVGANQVEEIHFQDKWNNEYAILLNGVLMTPIGMPLPWGYDDYNIVQQNLEPFHPFFAYGRSLVKRMKANTAIYDEMLKMAVLKTQKSFMPARANLTGKAVSRRMFMPGKMTQGIPPDKVPTFDQKEVEGVTQSELAMIQKIEQNISSKSMPQIPPQAGRATNAKILMQQQEAKLALGWFLFFDTLLEQKLAWLRLFNNLANYFKPTESKLDDARKALKNKYRVTSQDSLIPGKGMGTRIVLPTDDKNVGPEDVFKAEQSLQKQYEKPFQVIVVQPEVIKEAEYTWEITVSQREKKTSEASKVMFRGMMQDIEVFGQDINMQYLEEEFAMVWAKDPSKLFKKPQQGQGAPAGPSLNAGMGAKPNAQQGSSPLQKPTPNKKIAGMPEPNRGLTKAVSDTIK